VSPKLTQDTSWNVSSALHSASLKIQMSGEKGFNFRTDCRHTKQNILKFDAHNENIEHYLWISISIEVTFQCHIRPTMFTNQEGDYRRIL
jgi:hypothetical protein